MGKRDLVALLNLSSWCLVMVERLFLGMPRGCLRFVIVVFPDHTHYFGERTRPTPGSAGSEFGEKTGQNPGSAGSELRERNGLYPGSAGSEFGERTWLNPDSDFGFGVGESTWPFTGSAGSEKGPGLPLVWQFQCSEKRQD